MRQEAYFCTVKELDELGKNNIPRQLISHTHLIYSSPATLAFNSPGAEGFGVKRAGLAVPDSIMLIVAPGCCGRNTSMISSMPQYEDRFFYLTMDETDIVTGRHLKKVPKAVQEICDSLAKKPSVVMICITCVDALLGTDMERICRKSEEKTGLPVRPCYMYALTREGRKPPMVHVRQSLYSLLEPKKKKGNVVNLLGFFSPLMDDCELYGMLEKEGVDAVIHCAALKAVGESVQKPLEYYRNNITGTLTLMDVMKQTGVKNIVFSSSATVYGSPEEMPITEECPKGQCTNPYGWTKSMMEQIMTDVQKANPDMNVILLRYFNPVGAHDSGRIGEDPKGIPNNLMPYISQVAVGKLEKLGVFGDDYDTPDGTGVRDYIHVVDLAKGHVKAINYIFSNPGLDVINLGTGVGYSVLDMVKAFGKACGKEIPYEIKPRRAGDIAMCYADPAKAARVLGWKAEKGLDEMCADTWRWQSQNPNGYES